MASDTAAPLTEYEPKNFSIWRPRNLALILIVLGIVNLGLTLLVREISLSSTIPSAVQSCKAEKAEGVSVSDDQRKILIDAKVNPGDSGASDQLVHCLIGQLHVPAQLVTQVVNSPADQREQAGSWDGFDIRWMNDPQNGYLITISRS